MTDRLGNQMIIRQVVLQSHRLMTFPQAVLERISRLPLPADEQSRLDMWGAPPNEVHIRPIETGDNISGAGPGRDQESETTVFVKAWLSGEVLDLKIYPPLQRCQCIELTGSMPVADIEFGEDRPLSLGDHMAPDRGIVSQDQVAVGTHPHVHFHPVRVGEAGHDAGERVVGMTGRIPPMAQNQRRSVRGV